MKRMISYLLVAILLVVQMAPNIPIVYAQSVNGEEEVTYTVDKVYEGDSNTTNITVKAQPGLETVTVDSITTPEGEPTQGSEVTYEATANGSYKFTVNYTVETKQDESITSGPGITVEPEFNKVQKTLDIIAKVTEFTKEVKVLAGETVAINETNFEDKNFREYVQKQFDKDGNGFFDQEELGQVEEIKIYRDSDPEDQIKSLEGIKYFSNLKKFIVYSDELESVDVSNNTNLLELTLASKKLESVDVSNNTNLLELTLEDVIKLKDLDVSNNTNLEKLTIRDNLIRKFDLTKNLKLKVFNLSYSGMTGSDSKVKTIDVSKNTELVNLQLYYTKIRVLDVSNNIKLKALGIAGNPLKKLDISNNIALESLQIPNNRLTELDLSGNPNLSSVFALGNELTALDLSNNKALEFLNLSDNQLAQLDLSNNGALEELDVNKNQLTTLDVSELKNLETLYCEDNRLAALDLSKNTSLQVASLGKQQVYNDTIWVQNGSEFQCDLKKLVGEDNIQYISNLGRGNVPIEMSDDGIITSNEIIDFHYVYNPPTNVDEPESMDVSVDYANYHSISASAEGSGSGSITPSGATWVKEGMDQSYKITPDPGCIVDQLIVNGNEVDGDKSTYTFKNVRSNQSIVAVFTSIDGEDPNLPKEYYISAKVNSQEGGTINPPGVTTVKEGESQTYTFTPGDGMEVDYLLIDGKKPTLEEGKLSYTFSDVRENHRIVVFFVAIPPGDVVPVEEFKITATATGNGYISPGTRMVKKGEDITYTIEPRNEYTIDKLIIDGIVKDPPQFTYKFENVTKKHEIEAIFKKSEGSQQLDDVPITDDAFSGGGFQQYVRRFDTNVNGVLEKKELDKVTTITIDDGDKCSGLKGIENFTNLKELTVHNSWLKELDLSHNTALEKLELVSIQSLKTINLENNTKLKNLVISKNEDFKMLELIGADASPILDFSSYNKLVELELLDFDMAELILGKQDDLKSINVSHTGKDKDLIRLESIDLEGCKELETLDCRNSELRTLDVSKNTKLKNLDCSDTLINKLDLKNNKDLEVLNCSWTDIKTLDLTNKEKLTDLDCSMTKIKEINTKDNIALKTLDCRDSNVSILDVSNSKELEVLRCDTNNLTRLDVSNNIKLTTLGCEFNQLTKLDITKNINLEYLNCRNNQLTELDASNKMALEVFATPQRVSKDKTWVKKGDIYEFNLTDLVGKERLKYVVDVTNDLDEELKFYDDTGIIESSEQCDFSYRYEC